MECPYCGSDDNYTYFSIERLPTILSACPMDFIKRINIFPFKANLCRNCYLGFNSSPLNEEELKFIYENYLYISPFSGIGYTKYLGMLNLILKFIQPNERVVEIGCSEGYLLYQLKSLGYKNLIGIEPSIKAEIGKKFGIRIERKFFDNNIFFNEQIDCFILMHVFEHFKDPFSILEHIKNCLSPSGKIIIEVPYFDGYHHEHLFFYCISFLKELCADRGLKIIYLETEKDILRIVVVNSENKCYDEYNIGELNKNVFSLASEKYNSFKYKINRLNDLLKKNREIVWWGAGSSSVIFLNQLDMDLLKNNRFLIIDGDKNKWENYIPLYFTELELKVHPYNILKSSSLQTLIIASMFVDEIMDTLNKNDIHFKHIWVFT